MSTNHFFFLEFYMPFCKRSSYEFSSIVAFSLLLSRTRATMKCVVCNITQLETVQWVWIDLQHTLFGLWFHYHTSLINSNFFTDSFICLTLEPYGRSHVHLFRSNNPPTHHDHWLSSSFLTLKAPSNSPISPLTF